MFETAIKTKRVARTMENDRFSLLGTTPVRPAKRPAPSLQYTYYFIPGPTNNNINNLKSFVETLESRQALPPVNYILCRISNTYIYIYFLAIVAAQLHIHLAFLAG